MELVTYLSFDGRCEEAFKLYERVLGGKITFMMRYGESPIAAQMQAERLKWIYHATLEVGKCRLQGADVESYQKPQGFNVSLNLKDADEAERIFKALAENGSVQMALQETFWAPRFGVVVDRFGTPWMINCGKSTAP